MPAAAQTADPTAAAATATTTTHVDVLIVGAGISGIGAAWHLQHACPGKSYAIVEMKDTFGGTWETHKYPGVRSDSDLYTFGYSFKPWTGTPIASGQAILDYMGEVIAENHIDRHIRYGRRITHCAFSRATNRWTVRATRLADGVEELFTCEFLWMCQGYYDHEKPHIPDWPGRERFSGEFVHAQLWHDGIDYKGKRVLVIGSGATAATVVPAIAGEAAHVTLLQRSPTYFFCAPNRNELADRLREVGVDEPTVHRVVRMQILHDQKVRVAAAEAHPDLVFEELKELVRAYTGQPDFPFEPHFTPRYRPWQQRLAFCPEGDLFRAAVAGQVSVVTDTIETFTETGVRTHDGTEIEADLVIAATGFELSVMGGIPFEVDGEAVDWPETITWRGTMFTGVPNMAWIMGYFRASWTLRVDLLGEFTCRLLNHMAAKGAHRVEVVPPGGAAQMARHAWVEPEEFNPGYMMRAIDRMPRAGEGAQWRHTQDYWAEREELPALDLDAPELHYSP